MAGDRRGVGGGRGEKEEEEEEEEEIYIFFGLDDKCAWLNVKLAVQEKATLQKPCRKKQGSGHREFRVPA